jgi:two-component system, NarL family, nitrate/nitrite response regulator NarL
MASAFRSESPNPRILIVAEVRLYREGIADAVARENGLDVVATARNGWEAAQLARTHSPDVVLIDSTTGCLHETAQLVLCEAPEAKFVAVGVRDDETSVLACLQAGAVGYVPSDSSIQDLVQIVKSVANGGMICPPHIATALARRINSLATQNANSSGLGSHLTSREDQIVDLLGLGLSNKQIAFRLQIRLATVKNHIHNILEKAGARSRGEAIARLRNNRPDQPHL